MRGVSKQLVAFICLFTVLSVFAPPVGNAENKADKQSKFR